MCGFLRSKRGSWLGATAEVTVDVDIPVVLENLPPLRLEVVAHGEDADWAPQDAQDAAGCPAALAAGHGCKPFLVAETAAMTVTGSQMMPEGGAFAVTASAFVSADEATWPQLRDLANRVLRGDAASYLYVRGAQAADARDGGHPLQRVLSRVPPFKVALAPQAAHRQLRKRCHSPFAHNTPISQQAAAAAAALGGARVHVVSTGVCNMASIVAGLKQAGAKSVEITSDPDAVRTADFVVVPGVGSFASAALA